MAWDLTAELTQIRADVSNVLPETCVIARLAEVSDGQGGLAQSWAAVGTVAARLVANTGNTRGIAAQTNTVGAYTLTIPFDADIVETDRATISSTAYRVVFVENARTWRAAKRCQVNLEI